VGKHFIGNERRVALLRMLHMCTLPPVCVLLLVMKSVFRFVAECACFRQCAAGDDDDYDEKHVALLRIRAELWQGHCCRRANMK
jgi:hypothetical protein